LNGCLNKIAAIDKRIPFVLQDSFLGDSYWSPLLGGTYPTVNIVVDTHIYYFAATGTYAQYVLYSTCGQGAYIVGDSKFPVLIGEWSLQSMYNNTLAGRKIIFDTQRYAWQKYVSGGAFWTGSMNGTDAMDGEGTQRDYWGYKQLIDQGVTTTQTNSSYC
jgi:glucan 1,3-beta-glucosidase